MESTPPPGAVALPGNGHAPVHVSSRVEELLSEQEESLKRLQESVSEVVSKNRTLRTALSLSRNEGVDCAPDTKLTGDWDAPVEQPRQSNGMEGLAQENGSMESPELQIEGASQIPQATGSDGLKEKEELHKSFSSLLGHCNEGLKGGHLVELHPTWLLQLERRSRSSDCSIGQIEMVRTTARNVSGDPHMQQTNTINLNDQLQTKKGNFWRYICLHPNSPTRFVWDAASLIVMLYELIFLPLSLLDFPADWTFIGPLEWVIRIFWTLDILMSFATGYIQSDGTSEERFLPVVRHYLQTWFIPDLALVLVDWLSSNLSGGMRTFRAGKALRFMRMVRMLRLVRLLRMQKYLDLLLENAGSNYLVLATDFVKITLCMLVMSHVLACLWYGIGNDPQASGPAGWVQETTIESRSLSYRYLSSLHWSLAQFAGGMDELRPFNELERIYAISTFILCFVLSAIFVSTLTTSMTRFTLTSSQSTQELSRLRLYLRRKNVSGMLFFRILRNVRMILSEDSVEDERSTKLLQQLSQPLQLELHFQVFRPFFQNHVFFDYCISACPKIMQLVCHQAVSSMNLAREEILFREEESCPEPKMYILAGGSLLYSHRLAGESVIDKESQTLSEAAVWLKWVHAGAATAMEDCRLCVLDVTQFHTIMVEFPKFNLCHYASEFLKLMESHEVLTDLELDSQEGALDKAIDAAGFAVQSSLFSRRRRGVKSSMRMFRGLMGQ